MKALLEKKSKILAVAMALLLMIMFMPSLPGSAIHAESELHMKTANTFPITFDKNNEDATEWFFAESGTTIDSVTSSDPSVAKIQEQDSSSFIVRAVKPGTATVRAEGHNGSEAASIEYQIEVNKSFFEKEIKQYTHLSNVYYGSKKIIISSLPGAVINLKVGSDKFKNLKMPTGSSPAEKVVKLKKVYPLNTKVTGTVSHNGYTSNITTYKMASATSAQALKVIKKKKVKVTVFNLHKGDVVKVTYKGKTKTKKIKKNYDSKNHSVTVKFKKKLKKNSTVTVKILNAKKKSLYKEKIKLADWKWEFVDDEDPGSED